MTREADFKAAGEAAATGRAEAEVAEPSPGVEENGEHLAAAQPVVTEQETAQHAHARIDGEKLGRHVWGRGPQVEDELEAGEHEEGGRSGPPAEPAGPADRLGTAEQDPARPVGVGQFCEEREWVDRLGPVTDQRDEKRYGDPDDDPEPRGDVFLRALLAPLQPAQAEEGEPQRGKRPQDGPQPADVGAVR